MPNELSRAMRLLRSMDEKLDVALSGHGERLDKLEKGQAEHEARLTTVERTLRWVVGKIEGHGKR